MNNKGIYALQRINGMPLPVKSKVPYHRYKGIPFFNTIKDNANEF